ncbi:response regulator, partial [Planctomycetota bacterium]
RSTERVIDTDTVRVVVADDHPVLREGLCKLLAEETGFEVVGEAGDGREAVRKVSEFTPDVVVLDVSMPGMNGIQAAHKLKAVSPSTKIVMLTVHQEEEYVCEALRAGASAYVLKDAEIGDLITAIRAAIKGETYLSPGVEKLIIESGDGSGEIRAVSQHLTKREREVCKMLAIGHTVPEIATMIGISRKTVDVHKTRLMKKLGVHNRAELVTYAIKNKLVEV